MDQYWLSAVVTPSIQLRSVRALFRSVQRNARAGNTPVVEIDLDLCALMPLHRTRQALIKTGEDFNISEFLDPARLAILPGYSDEAWLSFIEAVKIEGRYPRLAWKEAGKVTRKPGTPFARFHDLYWTTDWLYEDSPTPGLGAFVHRIEELGGIVVFLSGRWLKEQIKPTVVSLRRAGIAAPNLVIGNPWHETLSSASGKVLSDAEIKAYHQQEIRKKYGIPVAIIDDRVKNREAVLAANRGSMLSIAIAIPDFTCDPVSANYPVRLSTFETFDTTVGDPPIRSYMLKRYDRAGSGFGWFGLYEGLGRNELPYALPRLEPRDLTGVGFEKPYTRILEKHESASIAEDDFLDLCESTIPESEMVKMRTAVSKAEELASQELAAPFPVDSAERQALWLSLVTSWLHSRDIDNLMARLGYRIQATGVHDMEEYVRGVDIVAAITRHQKEGSEYSRWLLRWLSTITSDQLVNVGFLNASLLVSTWRWTPHVILQDAMDVHRVSSHHSGDSHERYDPLEAAVNNLLHQREGMHGIRKEPVQTWRELELRIKTETGAETLAQASVGRTPIRDALVLARRLEADGVLTPWRLVVRNQLQRADRAVSD